MKPFKIGGYDRRVTAIINELWEPEMAEDFPEEGMARFALAMSLGLSDGDVILLDENHHVVLKTPLDEIERRIELCRRVKATGSSVHFFIEAGGLAPLGAE